MKFLGIEISSLNYKKIIKKIKTEITEKEEGKYLITYLTVASAYKVMKNPKLSSVYNKFNMVHPDGIGISWAAKILFGKNSGIKRMYGSDLYLHLIKEAKKNNWKIFFFGDTQKTLELISKKNPELNIVGFQSGFNFREKEVIKKINNSNADLLIVGMGAPCQELWVTRNLNVKARVIICVGDGIKVFAGVKKRGPKFLRKAGFEWLVRLLNEPGRLWKRYLLETPQLFYYLIKIKFKET